MRKTYIGGAIAFTAVIGAIAWKVLGKKEETVEAVEEVKDQGRKVEDSEESYPIYYKGAVDCIDYLSGLIAQQAGEDIRVEPPSMSLFQAFVEELAVNKPHVAYSFQSNLGDFHMEMAETLPINMQHVINIALVRTLERYRRIGGTNPSEWDAEQEEAADEAGYISNNADGLVRHYFGYKSEAYNNYVALDSIMAEHGHIMKDWEQRLSTTTSEAFAPEGELPQAHVH